MTERIYRMYDWGDTPGDWWAYGFQLWHNLHTGPGQFSWGWLDQWLDKQMALGRRAIFAIATHLSSAPNWKGGFYDGTPQWLYDIYDPGRPVMNGRRVGHVVVSEGIENALPAYEDRTGPFVLDHVGQQPRP